MTAGVYWTGVVKQTWVPTHLRVKKDLPLDLQIIALRTEREHDRAGIVYFETGVCTFDPRVMTGWPLGQMHCPVCYTSQVAGMPHIAFGREDHEEYYEALGIDWPSGIHKFEEGGEPKWWLEMTWHGNWTRAEK